jgi:hypothetical protein
MTELGLGLTAAPVECARVGLGSFLGVLDLMRFQAVRYGALSARKVWDAKARRIDSAREHCAAIRA